MGGGVESVTDFIILGSRITANGDFSHEIKRSFLFGRKSMTNVDNILKSRDITLPTKVRLVKAIVFPIVISYHKWPLLLMWELDHKEGWAQKNWSFQILVLEKTLESPLDSKEIKPVNLKEINPEYSLEGLMLKLNLECLNWLIGKDPDARKDWRQKEKGITEDERVR